jgi:hypothetical protein
MILDNEEQRQMILEALMAVAYPGATVKLAAATIEAVETALVKASDVVEKDANG